MFAKRVRLEMAPAEWQGRALIFSVLAEGTITTGHARERV